MVSLDDGLTWLPAVNGVRVICAGMDLGEDAQGELHLNMTHEGLITDIWDRDTNLATDSVTYQEIVDRLVP